jgi:hypothetical protein
VATALARLFLGRMRGELVPFDRVLAVPATPAGAQAVQAALTDDLITRARFRLVAANEMSNLATEGRPDATPPTSI